MAEQKNVNETVQATTSSTGPTRDYRNSEIKYAILQETNGAENETWINFIKYQGNEEALAHLNKQFQSVEFYILDDMSTFDLEIDYLVSELTAKEMSKVDLNHYSFHRKFDGVLQKIDLGLKEKQSNDRKLKNIFKMLGYGKIEDYIDQEDIDPEDLREITESESEETEESESEESETEESESESDSDKKTKKNKKTAKNPTKAVSKKIQEMPRFAKAKARRG